MQSASGITKCDRLLLLSASSIKKCDRLLLQSASGITKCGSYYKVRRNTLDSRIFKQETTFIKAKHSRMGEVKFEIM